MKKKDNEAAEKRQARKVQKHLKEDIKESKESIKKDRSLKRMVK